ncbi:hypothetical protein B0G84_8406 [Paraburkholderia sp. BL8N3]|nr:hypothetical protein [Paraburkholderia sp. BL8N3]TCK32592.1 hypothetical protein B0G84_8406 [Paraburkholderia sp. BL8N3]
MRKRQDPDNAILKGVLESLVAENVDVTIREVAHRHPELKNASAFTRNPVRTSLIDDALRRQTEVRAVAAEMQTSHAAIADGNETQRARIATLDRQVRNLVAAHAGLIRAVQLAGGMSALERFWKEYRTIGDAVFALDAVPRGAVVQAFPDEPSQLRPETTDTDA